MTLVAHHGFILTSHYEDTPHGHVLRYFGCDAEGAFEIVMTDSHPLFFVERSAQLAKGRVQYQRKPVQLKTFAGQPVDAVYFEHQKDLYEAKDFFQENGVRTFEADVRPEERFLMERFVNGCIEFEGRPKLHASGLRQYFDPRVRPSSFIPKLKLLSLDIETSLGNDLFSIGVHFRHGDHEEKKVFMVGPQGEDEYLELYETEKQVYQAFEEFFHHLDPDVIVGWHVVGFDLRFLERKCQKWGIEFALGRRRSKTHLIDGKGSATFARMFGRVVVDGPPSLRAAFFSFEDFKLQTVAKAVLGKGKDIGEGGPDKVEEIERRFREDKKSLAKYNLLDCTLVLDIYEKTGLIDLITTRTFISGMLMDRVGASSAAFDHFMLPRIHRKGFVGPNTLDIQRDTHAAGGYVMEPEVGIHEHVVVLDFKSLYPSIIRTFKIDPYSRLMADINPVITPTGVAFSTTEHILPDFIVELMDKRAMAKREGNEHLSQAIKILMNSFYGVMGSTGSRFYHPDLPSSITGTGQWILKQAIAFFQELGYKVLYGDTDSVFIQLKPDSWSKSFEKGDQLAKQLNDHMAKLINKNFEVPSYLDIEFEKYYRKFFLPPARSGEGGAKKRYAGLQVFPDKSEKLQFSGMEIVRSDWTKLAKIFQYQVFEKLFAGEELEDFIRDFVKELKEGRYDNSLVYKKRLTKDISEYVKSVPPHARAAKMLEDAGFSVGRSIEYVMTRRGPVPLELEHNDLDYQHYIEKQLRPLADSVLIVFDKSFDNIVVGDQLSLF